VRRRKSDNKKILRLFRWTVTIACVAMTDERQAPKRGLIDKLRWRWFALWPISIALAVYPVSNRILRSAFLFCILLLIIGLLGFFWRVKWLRFTTLALVAFAIVCFVIPGNPIDNDSLRRAYTRSLKRYEGSRYVWGGENSLGIDCSGLVRAGLINAEFSEAFRKRNPALLRTSASLWWHDCSAGALGEGYRELTFPLFDAQAINQIDSTRLQPGDLAVTEDGIHVLAYLGNKTWIEADPFPQRVITVSVPTTNEWFDTPVKLVRWRQLQTADAN
jgi:NlpC/P60 family protein